MRLKREAETVEIMVGMYCKAHHQAKGGLCESCQRLCTYATQRVYRCKYGNSKPTCSKCTTHCYNGAMRQQIIGVMRYAGPRMLLRHPFRALEHLWYTLTRQ